MLKFLKNNWKFLAPILVGFVYFLISYFKSNPNIPTKSPYLVLTEPPTIIMIPFNVEDKAPLNASFQKSSIFLPEPIDTNAPRFEIDVSGPETKVFFLKDLPIREIAITPEINYTIKLQNKGDEATYIVLVAIGNSLDLSTYLRDQTYHNLPKKSVLDTMPDFSSKTILADSLATFFYPNLPLLFVEDTIKHETILHLLIVYSDGKGRFYDTYNWIKYKLHNPVFQSTNRLIKERKGNNVYLTFETILPDIKVEDYITYLDRDNSPAYFLNPDETKYLESILPKRKRSKK